MTAIGMTIGLIAGYSRSKIDPMLMRSVDVMLAFPPLLFLLILITGAGTGTGVLVVEHHPDLIFDICHHVTVLNLGKILAAGTPAEIRAHREVVNAYLGA